LDNTKLEQERKFLLMTSRNLICRCQICTGEWKLLKDAECADKQLLEKLNKLKCAELTARFRIEDVAALFEKSVKALTLAKDIPFSREYTTAYVLFRRCILSIQNNYCSNIMLSYDRKV
jgi:hypothetical protein